MQHWVELGIGVTTILTAIAGIYFGQKRITSAAKAAAADAQTAYETKRLSTEQAQRELQAKKEESFRDTLMRREELLSTRLTSQDQQIASLNALIVSLQTRLDKESTEHAEARKHREICERDMKVIRNELHRLKTASA